MTEVSVNADGYIGPLLPIMMAEGVLDLRGTIMNLSI